MGKATVSPIDGGDLWLLNEGRHFGLYGSLGAQRAPDGDRTRFAVLAPDAREVSVVGDFNGWNPAATPLYPRETSGVWEGFADAPRGSRYKYHVVARAGGAPRLKADPFGFFHEIPPNTAS